jgi:hypothetical protein
MDGKYVGDEVRELRSRFQRMHYSFDEQKEGVEAREQQDREAVRSK